MRHVLFVDATCPRAYAGLHGQALGGTEATVVRIAERLAALPRVMVTVAQHNRARTVRSTRGVIYRSTNHLPDDVSAVVLLREPQYLAPMSAMYPRAKMVLWSHDHHSHFMRAELPSLLENKPVVLAVSRTHRQGLARVIGKLAAVRYIYNPLDEALKDSARGTSYDPFQLVFTSSPHKGLRETLQIFQALRRRSRRFRLLITNPGYLASMSSAKLPAGVTSLGIVRRHRTVMEHVAASLCVFYPNYTIPEEFGLVYAESNAVGTPVLAHDHGAATEILRPRDQAMDCSDHDAVVRRVLAWANGERPAVKARAEFAIDTVIAQWRALLDLPAGT